MLVLSAVALSWNAMATTDPRAELDFFHGTWTVQGQEATYNETCAWLPGKGFLACNAEDRSEKEPSFSMSVFGYSGIDGLYTYTGFDGSGSQRVLRGSHLDGVWQFFGSSERGPNWRRWQVTIKPTKAGFSFRQEVSDRGGPWTETVRIEYVRLGRVSEPSR